VLFGMLVLGELPDPWTFVGTALIVLAGIYVVRLGQVRLLRGDAAAEVAPEPIYFSIVFELETIAS
jgi:hypothetical protein